MYIKRQEFALKYKKEPYSLDIVNRMLIIYNREIMNQETYKPKLRLRPHRELILFNITDINSSNIILEFL